MHPKKSLIFQGTRFIPLPLSRERGSPSYGRIKRGAGAPLRHPNKAGLETLLFYRAGGWEERDKLKTGEGMGGKRLLSLYTKLQCSKQMASARKRLDIPPVVHHRHRLTFAPGIQW